MDRPIAWALNFDADDELARPSGYTPSRAVLARAPDLVAQLGALLRPGDLVVDPPMGPVAPPMGPVAPPMGPGEPVIRAPEPARGVPGRAWCPTPRALALLRRAGVEAPPAPSLEVLRRVNHRRFCAELGQTLPGARYVATLPELEATIAAASPTGHWLAKRPFAFAGRGRRRVAEGALEAAARPWVVASLAPGAGLQVEPWVERRGDFSLHGFLPRAGGILLGAPCVQRCDPRGAYEAAARAAPGDLDEAERRSLVEDALAAGEALAAAGYFGPFGIDAFRWEDAGGALRWNPRCEINARYTMAWAIGMGDLRPDLE